MFIHLLLYSLTFSFFLQHLPCLWFPFSSIFSLCLLMSCTLPSKLPSVPPRYRSSHLYTSFSVHQVLFPSVSLSDPEQSICLSRTSACCSGAHVWVQVSAASTPDQLLLPLMKTLLLTYDFEEKQRRHAAQLQQGS